jgi:LCP family protein required for cell wall assembly
VDHPQNGNGRRLPGPAEPPGDWPGPQQQPMPVRGGPFATGGRPLPMPPPNGQGAPMRAPEARRGTATQSAPQIQRPPRIPNQLPGQASLPPRPAPPPQAPQQSAPAWPTDSPSMPAMPPANPARTTPPPPPRRPSPEDLDPLCLTSEMEAVSEETQKRRRVDHTLARFSKVHDELKAEERERKAKRKKLIPWASGDDELARLDELDESISLQAPQPQPQPQPQPLPLAKPSYEDTPAEETRLQKKKTKRRRRSSMFGKALAGTTAILVFLATGVAWGFKTWVDSNQHQVDALDQNSSAILDRAAQNGDENFLMLGSDTRDGSAAEDNVGDANSVPGARSDTIMIAHVPANRARAVVISFPRDLEVSRPACDGWDSKTSKYSGKQEPPANIVKLNSVFTIGGPKCVTKVIQQLSGLNINHFVGIDFNGFKEMVDAVQGVQVCVERPLKDGILGVVVPQAGTDVTLTGDQALNFVRARHVQGDPTSDYGRIKRQQRFLSALLRKAMSSQVLLDPGKLTGFVQAFSKATFGDNIGIDQLMTLGQSMQGLQAGRVTFITVPTVGVANARGNETLRNSDNDALFKAIRNDSPLPGEAPAPPDKSTQPPTSADPPAKPVDPKTIKLQVLNAGNKTARIAGKTSDKLKDFGYQVVRFDNALEQVDKTVVRYGKDNEAAARTLASSIPGAAMQEDPSAGGALLLLLGPEYKGDVVAPNGAPAGGSTQPPQTTDLPKNLSTVNGGDITCA